MRPGFFSMVGVALVAGVLADVGHLLAQAAPAQAPASLPSFDVASIKPNSSNDGRVQILGRPGQFAANNVTVQLLVQQAFRIQNFQIVGAPAWLSTDRFDVNAKIPADGGQQNEMLQSLLIDRMRLKFHRETREMPVYALVLARSVLEQPLALADAGLSQFLLQHLERLARAVELLRGAGGQG